MINELEQLKRDNEVLYRDNVALSETADRLREALERIVKATDEGAVDSFWINNIARAALEGKP